MNKQMTLEQARDECRKFAIQALSPSNRDFYNGVADAIDAHLNAAKGEVVYQLECDGQWVDVDSADYEGHDGSDKRVLYTHPASPDVVRNAERWRFFCEEMTHSYGDGYNEPKECHAQLTWQQGPWIRGGSNGGNGRPDTFPGWNSVIDEAMENQRRELLDLEGEIAAMAAEKENKHA